MHMNYFGVTVIPRLPDILTVTAVEMIFYYTDYEKFLECMKFWESRYQVRDFVRFTIVDQKQKEIAGMVEICPSYKYSADGSKIGI